VRLLRAVLCAAVLAGAAPSAGANDRPGTAVAPPGVPSATELEARGATIGTVYVYVQNIFDNSDPRESQALYRLANDLHYATREGTIRRQLLFTGGERLVAQRLEESERLLRTRPYLNDAWILPVAYDAGRNVADVAVTVRDVWTLNPSISFGRAGGANHTRFQIEDKNLFGRGIQASVGRSRDVDRTGTVFSYFDPDVGREWVQLGLGYADNSDGRVKSLDLERPFYALDVRRAGGVNLLDDHSTVSRYSGGAVADQFEQQHRRFDAYYGWSDGLRGDWTQRWFAGARYDESKFARRPDLALQPAALPPEWRYAYPWLGWQLVENRYLKSENLDLIGRTEDLYLGRSLYLELGYSTPAFGADAAAWLPRAVALAGWQLDPEQLLFLNASFDGRVARGTPRSAAPAAASAGRGLTNTSLAAQARYFWRLTPHQLFYASLGGVTTSRLDSERQVLLGGDTGLRGYPLRFQGGTSSALLTLEHRVFTDWYPLRLARIGGAVFFDAGRTFGRDFLGVAPLGLLKDAGLGIRVGNNRSGLGNVLHVDFSYALDAPSGVKRYQVTVQTQDRF